jgi:hypothetical protein
VSKKRPSSRRRTASVTRRKPAKTRPSKRPTASKRRVPAPRRGRIELKPIAVLIGTTLERLKRIPQTPGSERTIRRLEHCAAELAAACDPLDSDCGPDMVFPEPDVL